MQTQMNNLATSNQRLKSMLGNFIKMNTASSLGTGSLSSNTVANPKGELKAITTRSGLVLDEPSLPMPPPFINPEDDERVEETFTDPDQAKDPRHPNIPYPSRMNQEKQKEKDKVQIHKFWQMFKQLYINITLADALILIPKYQKMLKSLLSNKEKLLELANTPVSKNCLAVILKKLPEKLGDPGKFLISYDFSELKCKALADLGASINLMPLSVWKELGLPELISTRMTLELANWDIYTPKGIARDVFILVGKFTFPADFVIIDYESDPHVPLILGRPFLRTARALIDVYGEEMILRDGHERLTLNMRNDTSSYSNQLHKESINMIDIYNVSNKEYLEDFGSTTYPSPTLISLEESELIWEEFEAYLASDSFPPGNDDQVDLSPEKFVDELALTNNSHSNDLVDTIPEMFTDEHALDYSSLPLWDDYDDEIFDLEPDNDYVYDDLFDFKEEKIKESKLLIDELNELDPPRSSDLLPSPESDPIFYEDFSKVDALPSTNNEDKNMKKISHASLILEDFNPPLSDHELTFHLEVTRLGALLSFSSENEEKVFNPGILISKRVHTSLLLEISHRDSKAFKVINIFESSSEIFPCSYGEDIRVLDIPCLHFYPL
ncbi:reverse transcriptase domain-containing protein [Tanacetum coccineum]|uniref:Reverse transcriptase domain-containing protein n=1 Tax=Tanacetum coccineum TaxID=301880 RepID=A0ABQ5FBX2_9ASTR